MAAATEVEETEGGNEHNSLKHRQNPEKHVVYKRKLQIQPPPLETRADEAPPPRLAPQPLEEAPPVLLESHLTKKKKNSPSSLRRPCLSSSSSGFVYIVGKKVRFS